MTMPKGSKSNHALLAVLTRSYCLKKAMMVEFTTLRRYPYNLQGVDYNGVDTSLSFLIFMMQYGDTLLSIKQAYEHFSHRRKCKPPYYWRRKVTDDWCNAPGESEAGRRRLCPHFGHDGVTHSLTSSFRLGVSFGRLRIP